MSFHYVPLGISKQAANKFYAHIWEKKEEKKNSKNVVKSMNQTILILRI